MSIFGALAWATNEAVEFVPSQQPRTSVAYRLETTPAIPIPDAMWDAGVRFVIGRPLKGAVTEAERRAANPGNVGSETALAGSAPTDP